MNKEHFAQLLNEQYPGDIVLDDFVKSKEDYSGRKNNCSVKNLSINFHFCHENNFMMPSFVLGAVNQRFTFSTHSVYQETVVNEKPWDLLHQRDPMAFNIFFETM